MNPHIQVILPVRNGAATLDVAIESVLASVGVRVELLCVNDGSTDDTAATLDDWFELDARVRVAHQPARGICAALNAGIELSTAPWIARMDADDEMHPERLAEQVAYLESNPDVGLVGCQVESFREGGLLEGYQMYSDWANSLLTHEQMAREIFIDCPLPHPTWLFRRESLTQLGGYRDLDWPEDLDLLYRLLHAGGRLGKVERVLYRWRDHDGRLSRVDPRYDRAAFSAVKAHWLGRLHPMPEAVVWGAGRTGRRMVKLLESEGTKTRALIDVNPARVGTQWHGIPILSIDELEAHTPRWRAEGLPVLAAVASRGARDLIRAKLTTLGLVEGQEFWMVA